MTIKEYHTVQKLTNLAKSQSNPRLSRRIQAIALAQQGYSCPEIVQITGNSRRAIQAWVAKYNAQGIEGLKERPGKGRRPKLPAAKYQKFRSRLDAGPTEKDRTATLYGKDIQRILEREFGVVYSLNGVYQLLHRLGYSCLTPRPRHEQADVKSQQQFKKTWAKC
jgi:transposase